MAWKSSKESKIEVSGEFGGKEITFESGWVAKQAGGSVIVRQGETLVMVTMCSQDAKPDQNFFPMVVEYQERAYAAGKIPGGYIKREGRPGDSEILTARLIDRPIRPMFPDGYMDEVQIICTVLSADGIHSPDVLAMCGASAALHISKVPFLGPLGGVRVARVDSKFIANPTPEELEKSDMDIFLAATSDSIIMVEGGAKMVPEAEIQDALNFGQDEIRKVIKIQEELREKCGVEKIEFVAPDSGAELRERVLSLLGNKIEEALKIKDKQERNGTLSAVKSEVKESLLEEFPDSSDKISDVISKKVKDVVRALAFTEGFRIDGRGFSDVRPIECETSVIPRAHGSALFTRGETQAIVTATLGTASDAQRQESLQGMKEKTFMLHYNFPPYSTGEVKMLRSPGRREVGHGNLAERALIPVIPAQTECPYVIRIVSDITESNGSSSMASVCGGALSLMDAGIKIKAPVAGVAMGLLKEGDNVVVLTDILGDEDHYGDMDFKVCGTEEGITALQMDIKCTGLSRETMKQALEQARQGRLHILGEMKKGLAETRDDLSKYAPRITTIKIKTEKIREVIGSGGKTIQGIVAATGVSIDIDDDGTVKIASSDQESAKKALEIIKGIVEEAEIGKIYKGVVKRIADFGAFVEILPGTEGLVHISQLEDRRVEKVTDVLSEGDEVMVKVLDIDRQGKIRLSRKEALDA